MTTAIVVILLILPFQAPRPAVALTAPVTQPVMCTMANSATQATLVLTDSDGSTPIPSEVACDGMTHNITVDNSTILTATEPPDSPPTRYRFPGGQSSIDFPVPSTCSSGTCPLWSITNYYQSELEVYYSVIGGGSPAGPTFACPSSGSPASAVLTTSQSPVWVDNGCSWTITPNPLTGGASGERWESQSQLSGVVVGEQTIDPLFFHQFEFTLSYSVVGSGPPVAPSLTSTQFGSSVSSLLSASPQGYWLDSDASWSVSNPTPGSTSTERWQTSNATSGTLTSPSTSSFTYYDQHLQTLSYSVSGGGSEYDAPIATGAQYGSIYTRPLTTSGSGYWFDAAGSVTFTNPLGGSGASERWDTTTTSVSATSSATKVIAYYHQYLATLSYSVSGGGTPTAPTLTSTEFGSSYTSTLTSSATGYWLDNSAAWSFANPLAGSGSTQRWDTNSATSGTVSAAFTQATTYFNQFYVTFGYSVIGGGIGYSPPSVQISQFGTQMATFAGWADAASHYSFTNPLNGSSSTERWYTGSAGGLIRSSSTVNATYYRQYDFVLSYTVVGSATQTSPPTLNSTFLGSPLSNQLQATPTDNWLDSGSSWVVSSLLPGSSKSERWMTGQTTQGTVRAGSKAVLDYYDQYAAGFAYSIKGGGSPQPPSLNYTSLSVPVSAVLSNSRAQFWLDTHSTWSLTNPIPGQSLFERWIASQGISGTALDSFNETTAYVHQYYVDVEVNAKAGGFAEPSSAWYDFGTSLPLNATASPGWKFSGWAGAGEGSYSGSSVKEVVPTNSAINETAVFYAGLIVTSGPGGSVQYGYGEVNGSVQGDSNATLFVVPGTNVSLTSTPSTVAFAFRGWSGNLTGAAQNSRLAVTAPMSVSATFGLDYTDIATFYGVAIVVTVMTVFVFVVRRRHEIFGSGQLVNPVI